MAGELKIIRNIYFDTSALISLPLTAQSPDFLNLKDMCNIFETKLLIPELVLKEYINYNQREVRAGFLKIEDSVNTINNRVLSKISFASPNEEAIFKETEELIKKKIEDLGIGIFKKDISFDKLEELALKEISFKEKSKKKGLRDSIILLSIIENAKKSARFLDIFIANDKFFQIEEAKSMIESCKADIRIVRSISEAIEIIKESLNSFGKAINEEREKRLKHFLETQGSKIIEFVRKGQFNSFMLTTSSLTLTETVEKIEAIDYESIHSVRPPKALAKEEATKVKISFMVSVRFSVAVSFYPFHLGRPLRLEQPGEEPQDVLLGAMLAAGSGEFISQNRKQTISNNISVEASAILKLNKEGEEEYSDLELERLII